VRERERERGREREREGEREREELALAAAEGDPRRVHAASQRRRSLSSGVAEWGAARELAARVLHVLTISALPTFLPYYTPRR
jgi:hypothetical protein